MLNGKLVESVHEKVISKELFLKVNDVRQEANKYGAPHQKEIETVPLKVFMRCRSCDEGYAGYIVKKKTCGIINVGQRVVAPIKVLKR